ncbi:MAG: DUF2142 domain-containing protein [Actinomycetota bacterium]|nr:DUF2142 domain-containing protein [Actinomycetota bacterium]
MPRVAVACAALAFVNGAVWGLITPPFQAPDEIDHINYVQFVAEWRDIPGGPPRQPQTYSDELAVAVGVMPWTVEGKPRWDPRAGRRARDRVVEDDLGRRPSGSGGVANTNPPLYYVLDAVPYELASGTNFYDRVYAMRLLSALLAALTVAFIFLFVREVLPRPRWAAPVGALAVAFQPMFGFMSGGVNNDNALYACSAVLIYLVARILRRGLTPALGLALGLTAVAGLLAKMSFAGLLPGAAAAVLVALWRAAPQQRRRALVATAAAGLTLAIGFGAWIVVSDVVFGRSAEVNTAGYTSEAVVSRTSVRGHLSYVWQAFLPRLPGMQEFPALKGNFPLWDSYFQGFVGRFGWWLFGFPMWVNWLALYFYLGVLSLAGVTLFRFRAALRRRWPELVCFLLMAAGFAVLVEVAAYRFQALNNTPFEQTRYLLPLLPFYGLLIAVAARAGGRRWGSALGAFFVTLAMGHSLFAMLLVASHYYA